jgi:hypothetical protein
LFIPGAMEVLGVAFPEAVSAAGLLKGLGTVPGAQGVDYPDNLPRLAGEGGEDCARRPRAVTTSEFMSKEIEVSRMFKRESTHGKIVFRAQPTTMRCHQLLLAKSAG